MPDYLDFTFEKFTFRVATDRLYHPAGVWAKAEGEQVIVGVTDFFQQHNGDVAFAEVRGAGSAVSREIGFADIETIKMDIELPAPVSGTIVAVNEKLIFEAEIINEDPYGAGWLAIIEAVDWTADKALLLSPEAYFVHMQTLVREEASA